jgi:heme/copper-type cytochrome/quinol oxidase subunit 2
MSIQDTISNDADQSSEAVKNRAKEEEVSEKVRAVRIQNDIEEQDKQERKIYAYTITVIVCFWLVFVALVFVASGNDNLHYSDSVLITLLTTTTANIIGLFVIVANYLFRKVSVMKKEQ